MLTNMIEDPPIQRVEVSFVGAPPAQQIERASGVSEVEVDGPTLRCQVWGSFQPFLEALSGHEVTRLASTSSEVRGQLMEQQRVLRWGGLAGILGASIAVPTALLGLLFSPPPAVGPCGAPCFVDVDVANFPVEKLGTSLGYGVYIAALILFVFFFLALYRALRDASLAPALFGGGMGLLGIVLMAAGGVPSVAFAHLSDLYYAPGVTPQDQATLLLVAHAVQGVFNETDTAGGIFLAIAFILLGTAMLRHSSFGKRFGGTTMALGVVGLIGIAVISIAQDNPNNYAFVIFVTILQVVLGWKLVRLSRASVS